MPHMVAGLNAGAPLETGPVVRSSIPACNPVRDTKIRNSAVGHVRTYGWEYGPKWKLYSSHDLKKAKSPSRALRDEFLTERDRYESFTVQNPSKICHMIQEFCPKSPNLVRTAAKMHLASEAGLPKPCPDRYLGSLAINGGPSGPHQKEEN
ncbi:hypothetical protein C8J57DRAFT_1226807 [Mycena rebaudengoi]|nr:hypothetical protein C8J57DRAFT_1226807 [Mycena rebaudengoi]